MGKFQVLTSVRKGQKNEWHVNTFSTEIGNFHWSFFSFFSSFHNFLEKERKEIGKIETYSRLFRV
jgi:hypothetical protein